MREIKFRLWSVRSKCFVGVGNDEYYISQNGNVIIIDKNGFIYETLKTDYIVNQSIGHKDKNGKEIFDGDIIKYEKKYFQIIYRYGSSQWTVNFSKKDRSRPCTNVGTLRSCEVVGNIYENIELLEMCLDDLLETEKTEQKKLF